MLFCKRNNKIIVIIHYNFPVLLFNYNLIHTEHSVTLLFYNRKRTIQY